MHIYAHAPRGCSGSPLALFGLLLYVCQNSLCTQCERLLGYESNVPLSRHVLWSWQPVRIPLCRRLQTKHKHPITPACLCLPFQSIFKYSGELILKSLGAFLINTFFSVQGPLKPQPPQAGSCHLLLKRKPVAHFSGDMLSPLPRSFVPRHQVVSRQSAGMQMHPQQRFNHYDPPICHRICSLPTALSPKLVSEQDPGCLMNPPASCLVTPYFRLKGRLSPLSSHLTSSTSFTSPCLRSLFFTQKY